MFVNSLHYPSVTNYRYRLSLTISPSGSPTASPRKSLSEPPNASSLVILRIKPSVVPYNDHDGYVFMDTDENDKVVATANEDVFGKQMNVDNPLNSKIDPSS